MTYILNSGTMALVQKGFLSQPGFFGSESGSDTLSQFSQAIDVASAVAGFANFLEQEEAPPNYVRTVDNYILTEAEKTAIAFKAEELSLLGVIPFDILKQFFYILAALENQSDLAFVGDTVGIPDLNNAIYVRNIIGILQLKDIYKIGYLASAVATTIQTFAPQYSGASQATSPNDSSNILSNISSLAGGANMLLSMTGGNAIGGFLSELVTGSRVSSQQIARNPNLSPPSFQGKAFFGESMVALPAIDQLFCKKIGAFSQESSSVGALSFGLQNFGSFSQGLNVNSVVSKFVTGSFSVPSTSTFIGQGLDTIIGNTCNILNVSPTSTIEMFRGDNAIPLMIGFTSAIAEQAQSLFSTKVFTEGWSMASSVANQVQSLNPEYLAACITSL